MLAAATRPSVRQLTTGLPFAAVFALLFWPTFVWMAQRFDAADSFYSHGWLIPFASGWLIWQRRERLGRCGVRPSYWGLALLIPSLLVHTVATWWQIGFASGLAMVGAVYGLVWTVWGWGVLWALRFPMLFLLFMVPLPGILLLSISFKMKLLAATLATHVLHLIGMPATQAGSTIHVPGISVIVDDTCSGLRSLITLIALSTLWTALMPPQARRWHKLTVVAASIPIALMANMVRIITLVLLSAIYGPKIAESFIHYGSGIVVFGVALAALGWLSRRLVPSAPTASA
ncbi:MAG: exosortase/archaeosortase family protein [Candidatus Omnitrophica bacterium]|nr:exosortase/archaeosortase family protein [Candidatus Omnitrophota bacterium]